MLKGLKGLLLNAYFFHPTFKEIIGQFIPIR